MESRPRARPSTRLDTAEPVDSLLQRKFFDEIFEANLERFLHQTSNLDRPWIDRESRSKTRDCRFVGREFVEVVIATGNAGGSQRSILDPISIVAQHGIKRIRSSGR